MEHSDGATGRPAPKLNRPGRARRRPRPAQRIDATNNEPTRPVSGRMTSIEGYRLTVVLNELSPWSWHAVDLLSQLGIEILTVHVRGAGGQRLITRTAELRLTGSTLGTVIRLRSALVRSESDAVLCLYAGRYALIGALATLLGKRRDLFLVVAGSDAKSTFGDRTFGWVFRRMRKWSFGRADLILTNGAHLRNAVLGIDKRLRPQVWMHGIATPALVERRPGAEPIRVFAPRTWRSVYNNEQIIDALELLAAGECAGIEVVLNGLHMPDVIRERVVLLAEKISIGVLDGYPFEDRYKFFSEATFVVSMARSDGVPNAVLEAAYAGCGLILGDIAATQELVNFSGLTARLVPLDSPEDLAAVLRECQVGHTPWAEEAVHNRHVVEHSYGPDRAKEEFRRILVAHLNDKVQGETQSGTGQR